jgi:hypothetical protein
MIHAIGILGLLIIAGMFCIRKHELIYYCTGDGKVSIEPPFGEVAYRHTYHWMTFHHWIFGGVEYSTYWVAPPQHYNCQCALIPMEGEEE